MKLNARIIAVALLALGLVLGVVAVMFADDAASDMELSSPLKKGSSPFESLRVSGEPSTNSGRGTAHAEALEAWGGVFQ
jgi:hypothetical protein